MTRCAFEGCDNLYQPCSRLTFFNLPKEEARREVWVANSGNRRLMLEYRKNTNVRRLFCENHFKQEYKKCQFNRTTLRREAVPHIYDANLAESFLLQNKGGIGLQEEDQESSPSTREYGSTEDVPVAIVAPRNSREQKQEHDEVKMEEGVSIEYLNLILENDEEERDTLDNSLAIHVVNKMNKSYSTSKPFHKASRKQKFRITENAQSKNDEVVEVLEVDESSLQGPELSSENIRESPQQEIHVEIEEPTTPHPNERAETSSQEDDRFFVLSLLDPLSKLTSEQRAIAKLNILKYLLELEVGKKTATL